VTIDYCDVASPCIGVYFLLIVGAHGERGTRTYNADVGAQPPAGSRGSLPLVRGGQEVRGEAPMKLKAF